MILLPSGCNCMREFFIKRENRKLSSTFPIENCLTQGDALSPLGLVQENDLGQDINDSQHVLAYADEVRRKQSCNVLLNACKEY